MTQARRKATPIEPRLSLIALGVGLLPHINIGEEFTRIHAELQDCPLALQLATTWAPRLQDLPRHLLHARPALLHIATHGNRDGTLSGLSLTGAVAALHAEALRRMLADSPSVRVATFTACHTDALAQQLAGVVDVAIGMSGELSDRSAIAFAVAFYRALAYHHDIAMAFEHGRTAVCLEAPHEVDSPQMYIRAGIAAKSLRIG